MRNPAPPWAGMALALLIPFALLAIAMTAAPARIGDGLLALDEDVRLIVFLTFAATIGIAALSLT